MGPTRGLLQRRESRFGLARGFQSRARDRIDVVTPAYERHGTS